MSTLKPKTKLEIIFAEGHGYLIRKTVRRLFGLVLETSYLSIRTNNEFTAEESVKEYCVFPSLKAAELRFDEEIKLPFLYKNFSYALKTSTVVREATLDFSS